MKKIIVFLSAFLLFACSSYVGLAQQNFATAPRTISYQGYLVDAAQKPLSGNHRILITLYDSPVEGSALHSESFTSSVDGGVFSVLIGSVQPLESSMKFDKEYWLGISVDDGAELVPRAALSSVPYAIHSDIASSLAKGATGAVTTLNGRSGDLSIKGGVGTLVESSGNTITITALSNSSIGTNQTQATTVNSITGTANQVLANNTSGSKQSGDVTLTLPQNIHAGASPTFAGMTLTNFGAAGLVHNSAAGALSTSLLANVDVAANAAIAYSKLNLAGSLTNADIVAGAGIPYSKLNLAGSITSGDIAAGAIMNSDVNAGAAIAYTKLNLAGSISNADVANGAAIAGSKLNLANSITSGDIVAGTIVNSDINANAAIAASKLNLANAITSGDIAAGTIVNSDVNAAAAIAYSKLNLTGNIVDADIANAANVSYSKLNLAGNIVNSDIANGASISASKLNLANAITSGDIAAGAIVNSDINANAGIAASKINLTNAIVAGDIAAGTITNADINANAGIAASKINLTNGIVAGDIAAGTITNADINANANIAASKLNLANAITSADIAAGAIVNSDVNAAAAISYSKLNLAGSVVDADIAGGANIAYSKLNLAGNIVNGDIAAGANISASKINLANAITSGDIAAGTIVNSDINAAAGIVYSKLNLAGSIVNGDIAGGAAIADTKLATIVSAGKVSNSATTATSNNTNNAIVTRDGSGNFSANTITATLNGNASNVSGTVNETHGGTNITTYAKGDILYASNANTLSKRSIGATGQVLTINGGVPVWSALSGVGVTSATGTANQVLVNGGSGSQITGGITLSLPQDIATVSNPTFDGATLSGLNTTGVVHNSASGLLSTSLVTNADVAAAAAIADTKLATISTAGKVANSATTATATNANNSIVARDASGGFSAGAISATSATLTGKATSASTVDADPPGTLTTKDYVDNIAIEYWSVTGNSVLDPGSYFGTSGAQDLSIRTNATEGIRLTNGGSVLFDGTSGTVPATGAGTRMEWIPSLGAIRAGTASSSEWDAVNIGAQSVAMGAGTQASGAQSVAMGFFSSAYGMGSTAIGSGAQAYVDGATAFGSAAQAAGFNSFSMGDNTTAMGDGSVAMGSNTTSNGLYSTAMGYKTTTTADNGMSTGKNLTVGQSSFGFNGSTTSNIVDVSAMNNTAYFGDVNMIIGNDDNTARSLMFYGANNSNDLSGAFYTSFTAQTQSANINYTLPASQGAANTVLTNDGTGVMSWSTPGSVNLTTGSGTANTIALWSSSSALGSASNLSYSSGKLGIGVSSPSQALDVSGNANVSGTVTSAGIAMTGGTAQLSYGTVTAGATITIPNNAVVKINDDGSTNANAVTMPSGTNGQIIYIYNNDANATSGDVTINAGAMGVFVYVDGWRKAN